MRPSSTTPAAVRAEAQPGVWVDSRLALWIERIRLLVMADLHWGYAASHQARGNLLPAWGDEEMAERLRSLVTDYAPSEMLWLGDVVHAAEGAAAAEEFLRTAAVPITLVAGNHDRRWRIRGESSVTRETYFFHHGDRPLVCPTGLTEVIGHHHPAIHWRDGAGGNVRLPALVAGAERIVLPAFSPWAAGTDCAPLARPGSSIWAVAPRRIFPVTRRSPASSPV